MRTLSFSPFRRWFAFCCCLYTPWPKITQERKGLFALHVLDTVHPWGKLGRKKFRVGTWSQELKQRQWRNIAYWFTSRGSLTSHFIQVRGYPGVAPTAVEWAFLYQMVKKMLHWLATGQCDGRSFSIVVSSSQRNTTRVELTKTNSMQKSHASLSPLDCMFWLGSDVVSWNHT